MSVICNGIWTDPEMINHLVWKYT